MPTTAGTAPPLVHVPPKPRLRGALHLVAFPVSLLAGGVLLVVRRRNQSYPFGPWLSIGGALAVLLAAAS